MQMTQNIVVLIFAVRKMNIVVDRSAALEALAAIKKVRSAVDKSISFRNESKLGA